METPETDSDLQALALEFARAAVAAGALIMDVYHRGFAMRAKADASPVCEADERSEALILERLKTIRPGDAFDKKHRRLDLPSDRPVHCD